MEGADTLISDEDTVFQPGDYDDCLLGLRGTFSEAKPYQIRNRMMRGYINKTTQGELEITFPRGYERNDLGHTSKEDVEKVGWNSGFKNESSKIKIRRATMNYVI